MGFTAKRFLSATVIIKILIFCANLIIPTAAEALEVNTTIGFNGYYQPGKWTPLTVIINNEEKSINGELVVELQKKDYFSNNSVIKYKKEINLPGNSRKQFSFVVPIDHLTKKLAVKIEIGDIIFFSKEVDLNSRKLKGDFALCLSRSSSLDFIQNQPIPAGRDGLQVLYPHAELLPGKWTGYDGVSLIVIHDAPLRLNNSQIKALNMWINSGGTLLISGGPHFTASHGKILDPLLPVEYRGLIRKENLYSLVEFTEMHFDRPGGFLLTDSKNRTGQILIEDDGIPILVKETRGKGSVFFLAFDYGNEIFDWSGRDKLWKTITENAVYPGVIPSTKDYSFNNWLAEYSLKNAGNILISKSTIALVVIIYFCIILFFIYVSRKNKKSGLKIALFFVIPGFITVTFYFGFFHLPLHSDTLFMDVSVISTELNKITGSIDKEIVIISMDAAYYEINVQDKYAVIQQMENNSISLLEQPEDNNIKIEEIRIGRWGHQTFNIHARIEIPIAGNFFMDDNKIQLSLINKSNYKITDGVLFYNNIPSYSGDFPPNGKISSNFYLDNYSTLNTVDDKLNYFAESDQPSRQAILDYLLSPDGPKIIKNKNNIVFAGWLEENPVKVFVDKQIVQRDGIYLVLIVIDLEEHLDEYI